MKDRTIRKTMILGSDTDRDRKTIVIKEGLKIGKQKKSDERGSDLGENRQKEIDKVLIDRIIFCLSSNIRTYQDKW